MSAIDTHPESLDGDSTTLQSQRVWKAAGKPDLDFDSQRLRNRLRAKMFGVDAAPINIGRFNVLETVGSGGMGVVYAAYDEELDRRVAVKLLRSSHYEDASIGKGRLLREAQALAKLSHPNVVQVYDVGTFDENVFLAMEFLPGPTLRAWILEGEQPWQDVLRHFIEAGQGLAAAHREGIIHRDFKPANLLFGADGRVRVVDFGLARATEHARVEPDPTPSGRARAFAVELTQTGEIMGTPAYMSPEQARYEKIDARSDQYSFCVALYEALFGRRPHVGRSSAEVLVAVSEGEVQPPPRSTKVPARIVRAVMRGLSASPDQRFPDMDALLAELSLDRSARWHWLGGGVVAALGLSAVVMASEAPCEGVKDSVSTAWNSSARAELRQAFDASGLRDAASTADRVSGELDDYASQWTEARQDVCEAHHVRRELSAELHDLRMACLLERRAELGAFAKTLANADLEMVEQAPAAVMELSAISACDDVERMMATETPEHRNLRQQLAEAKAWYKLGRYEKALQSMEHVASEARQGAAEGLEAEALYHRGIVFERLWKHEAAVETLDTAVDMAEAAGVDRLGAQVWTLMARQLAFRGRAEDAERSLRMAKAKLKRLGDDEELERDLMQARAVVAWQGGRHDEAIEVQQTAVQQWQAEGGDADPRLAAALNVLGNILADAGRLAEAGVQRARALKLLEKVYGAEHPRVALLLVSMGMDQRDAGLLAEARQTYLRAEKMLIASVGAESPSLIKVQKALGQLALTQEDYEEAELRGVRTMELVSDVEGMADHRLDALSMLASVAMNREQLPKAEGYIREYVDIVATKNVSPEYRDAVFALRLGLVTVVQQQGRHAEAKEIATRILHDLDGKPEHLDGMRQAAQAALDELTASDDPTPSSTGA
ncbi:MAG: serine/threonine-protein kinase [Myxococcota bacterium]